MTQPIAYAAAPAALSPAHGWRELLPQALALQARGISAPSFVVNNLDPSVVTMLVSRGLAILVLGIPPFERDARQLRWTDTGPTEGGALPSGWTQRVARRAIILPHAWLGSVSVVGEERVFLLISVDLDAAILAAQLAAAEQHQVPLQGLAKTYGRFLPASDGAIDFQIDDVDLSR